MMTKGDLPRTFLGRPIKPLVFAIMMSMATIFWFNLVDKTGVLTPTIAGNVVGYIAGASAVMLFVAWWMRSQQLSEVGLLMAAGVWISRTALIFLLDDWYTYSFFFSLSWCVASIGAYLLEAFDPADKASKWTR